MNLQKVPLLKTNEDGHIVLPMPPEAFVGFIGSLLGRQQGAGLTTHKPFCVKRSDLLSLYDLLVQRVAQQNNSKMTSTKFRIGFSDGTSCELFSREEFEAYAVIGDKSCTSIVISVSFLILFQDKESPERQNVTFALETGREERPNELFFIPRFWLERRHSSVSVMVEHTARTWAEDIISLSREFLTKHMLPREAFRSLVERCERWFQIVTSGLAAVGVAAMAFRVAWNAELEKMRPFHHLSNAQTDTIQHSMWALANAIQQTKASAMLLAFTVGMLVFVSLSLIVLPGMTRLITTPRSSAIVMSNADLTLLAKQQRGEERRFWAGVITFGLSILASLLANAIYVRL